MIFEANGKDSVCIGEFNTLKIGYGFTEKQADKFHDFIHSMHSQNKRCLLIITGKGLRSENKEGVLKQELPRWINNLDINEKILMFCTAQAKDGGSGAYYVLLRKNSRSKS